MFFFFGKFIWGSSSQGNWQCLKISLRHMCIWMPFLLTRFTINLCNHVTVIYLGVPEGSKGADHKRTVALCPIPCIAMLVMCTVVPYITWLRPPTLCGTCPCKRSTLVFIRAFYLVANASIKIMIGFNRFKAE